MTNSNRRIQPMATIKERMTKSSTTIFSLTQGQGRVLPNHLQTRKTKMTETKMKIATTMGSTCH